MNAELVLPVVVPQLDVNDVELELVSYHVEHGALVEAGGGLCTLETAKATHELVAEHSGVVHRVAGERTTVAVGDVIAWIGPSAEAVRSFLDQRAQAPLDAPEGELRITPKAEALCREHGLDPERVPRKGTVLKEKDVERFLLERGAPAPIEPADRTPLPDAVRALVLDQGPLPRHRAAIARHLAATQREVVLATVETDVELTAAEALLGELADGGDGGSVNVFHLFVFHVARLLERYAPLRSFRHGGRLYRHARTDVAFTLVDPDRDYRLVTPVVRGAGTRSLREIATDCTDLTLAFYRGEIEPADLQGACFTISMLTGLEITRFTALQNQFQSAVLAVGSPRTVVVADPAGGGFRACSVASLTLSYDHGVCDGYSSGEFLTDLKQVLEGSERDPGLE